MGVAGSIPLSRRTWRTVVVCFVLGWLLLLRLRASLWPVPSGYALSDSDPGVLTVELGSTAWLLGIEPGDRYAAWDGGGGAQVQAVAGDVGLAAELPGRGWWPLLAVMLILLVALAARAWAPRVARSLVVATSSLLALDLMGVAAGPAAPLVVVMPTLIAGTLLASMAMRAQAFASPVGLVAIAMAVEVALLGAATPASWPLVWFVAATLPAAVAAAIVIGATARLAGSVVRARRRGAPASAALIQATLPGRAVLREQQERWIDARVRWIHEVVLPRLSLGVHNVDMGNVAAGSGVLHALALDLREDLEHDQLSVLRVGGLRGALDGALDAPRAAGMGCSLDVDEAGAAPPWVVVGAWRVAQEAIENARRHSGADHIAVTVRARPDHLVLRVVDDGVGMDPQMARDAGHLGVTLMRDLARDVGADLRLIDRRPTGLEVAFEWRRW